MSERGFDQASETAEAIRSRCGAAPEVAIVLGSGLGDFATTLGDGVRFPYTELPHWPRSTVVGHAGLLVVGNVAGRRVAALAGRVHAYEGHSHATLAFAVRVMALLGVRTIILTNAAGGINLGFKEGALMVIEDHINMMGSNPLIGPNDERFGARFPDMTKVYSQRLRFLTEEVAAAIGVPLAHGVYVAVHGPSYETPAEIMAFRTLGADAVGMSTVPEVIVARAIGMRVAGISCVTNLASGISLHPLSHTEVIETTTRVARQFESLVEKFVGGL